MRQAMKTYFAIVHKDEDSAVGVVFPDLPGCFSAGDTYDKAIANAHVALRLYAEAELSAGRRLPKPRTFEALYRDRQVREEAKGAPFVGIRLDEQGKGPVRSTGSLRADKVDGVRNKHRLPRDGGSGTLTGAKSRKRTRKAG
jgi:predicted RNase H-like HicB family nuclease